MNILPKKEKVLLLLKKKTIELYNEEGLREEILEIPKEVLKNTEVINPDLYKEAISQFVTKTEIGKAEVLIILSDEIISKKNIPRIQKEEFNVEINTFFDEISAKYSEISKNIYRYENEFLLIATEKKFYQILIDALLEKQWEVQGVVPLSLYPGIKEQEKEESLKPEDVTLIFQNTNVVKKGNFLTGSKNEQTESSRNNLIFPVIGGVVTLIVVLGTLFFLGILKNPLISQNVEKIPEVVVPTNTPTPTIVPAKKEDLKIKVLNGTGIPKQASLVKAKLEGLEFKNIETENGDNTDATDTVITFSPKVSKDNREEIVTALEAIFKKVAAKDSEDEEFDITITTGQPL